MTKRKQIIKKPESLFKIMYKKRRNKRWLNTAINSLSKKKLHTKSQADSKIRGWNEYLAPGVQLKKVMIKQKTKKR